MTSGQLVKVVSAPPGTTGARVLAEMQRLYLSPDYQERYGGLELTFRCEEGVREGLHLEPSTYRSGSFSLKYRLCGEVFFVPVGVNLPPTRFQNAATSFLAMIRRGNIWSTQRGSKTITYGVAYGDRPGTHSVSNEEKEKKRNKRQSRRQSRSEESPCSMWRF